MCSLLLNARIFFFPAYDKFYSSLFTSTSSVDSATPLSLLSYQFSNIEICQIMPSFLLELTQCYYCGLNTKNNTLTVSISVCLQRIYRVLLFAINCLSVKT